MEFKNLIRREGTGGPIYRAHRRFIGPPTPYPSLFLKVHNLAPMPPRNYSKGWRAFNLICGYFLASMVHLVNDQVTVRNLLRLCGNLKCRPQFLWQRYSTLRRRIHRHHRHLSLRRYR